MKCIKHIVVAVVGAVCLVGCSDKMPKDVRLLQEGYTLEMRSEYDKAREKYAEAASMGNADALKQLGDLMILNEYVLLSPENASDYANGYDTWLVQARQTLAKAGNFYDKAKMAGCTNQLDASIETLAALTAKLSETEDKVNRAKERKRQEELRIQEEERQAELRRQEELRRKQEEKKRLAEEAARRAQAEEEERRRKESPEYCIENGILLSDAAFAEIVRVVNYSSDTGNKLYDRQKDAEEHARFRGKRLVLRGTVDTVETTFFTDEVKIILSRKGGTISARFDGMSKNDAASIRRGTILEIEGKVSDRPVLSSIAMDYCRIRIKF
ncbi:MAG: hypothetical protein IJR99_01225 [Kiritimatiellae bacterium]|nr:hypothetical protein [Kiritimatiellia bacterium]